MKALDYGPASLTSPLTNMNIVLVIAMGTFLYNEPLSGTQFSPRSALAASHHIRFHARKQRETIH